MQFVTTIRGYRDAKHIGPLTTQDIGSVIGTLFGVLINGTISAIVQTNDKLASSWSNILTAALLCFFIVLKSYLSGARRREYEESAEQGRAE